MKPKVYIIILNWNGWEDTIECIKSIFELDYDNFCLVLCDNASTDGSIDKIINWINRVMPFQKLLLLNEDSLKKQNSDDTKESKIIIIRSAFNRGYAGGNNLGLIYAQGIDDYEYIWLLNNDTVVDKGALTSLVEKMQKDGEIGICGSTLIYHGTKNVIQALGGATYYKFLGWGKNIKGMERWENIEKRDIWEFEKEVEEKLDYVIGASMLISKNFLNSTGRLSEEYFIYFEEIDWITRSNCLYKLGYAAESVVFHNSFTFSRFFHHANPWYH